MGTGSTNGSSFAGIKFRVAGASGGDYTKAGIFSRREGGYNDLSLIFALNTTADASSVSIADEKMRITSSGLIGINESNPGHYIDMNIGSTNIGIKMTSTDAGAYMQFADNNSSGETRIGAIGDEFKIDVQTKIAY